MNCQHCGNHLGPDPKEAVRDDQTPRTEVVSHTQSHGISVVTDYYCDAECFRLAVIDP